MVGKRSLVLLVIAALAVAEMGHAVTEPTGNTGNLTAQDNGDAIYRTGGWGYSHAGVYYLSGTEQKVIEVKFDIDIGLGTFSQDCVAINTFSSFKSGGTYLGAYANNSEMQGNWSKRDLIIGTALEAWARTNLYYTIWGQIDWYGLSWDGTISDLDNIRCDGLVEVAYELNSVKVWGKNRQSANYLIQDYPSEHNNAPNFPADPDPDAEVCPSVQRGGYGTEYTCLSGSIASSYLVVSGPTDTTENSGTAQYSSSLYYTDGSHEDATTDCTWGEDSAYASLTQTGSVYVLNTTSVSSDKSCTITASHDDCGKSDTHQVTITNEDTTPDAFAFTDEPSVPRNSVRTSDSITVTGINAAATISISGNSGQYEKNGSGSWTSSAGTVSNGDTVRVRQTSSANHSTPTDTVLNIGGVTDTFSVTTEGPPAPSITNLSPSHGPASGGNEVVITGTGFDTVTAVEFKRRFFNIRAAASFVIDSSTRITAVAPAGTAGDTVDVRVTSAAGTSADTSADDYSYDLDGAIHVGAPPWYPCFSWPADGYAWFHVQIWLALPEAAGSQLIVQACVNATEMGPGEYFQAGCEGLVPPPAGVNYYWRYRPYEPATDTYPLGFATWLPAGRAPEVLDVEDYGDPPPPTNLAAVDLGQGRYELSFAVENAAGYVVAITGPAGSPPGFPARHYFVPDPPDGSLSPDQQVTLQTTLDPAGTYTWQARGFNPLNGPPDWTGGDPIVSPGATPAAPGAPEIVTPADGGVIMAPAGSAELTLQWTSVPGAAAYVLNLSAMDASPIFNLAEIPGDTTSLRVTLPAGNYICQVIARNADDTYGPWSDLSGFDVVRDAIVPIILDVTLAGSSPTEALNIVLVPGSAAVDTVDLQHCSAVGQVWCWYTYSGVVVVDGQFTVPGASFAAGDYVSIRCRTATGDLGALKLFGPLGEPGGGGR